jgi:predicted AAA+ superfamily ATPase
MLYPRKIYEKIKKQVARPEILVLTGMRRVGKTTLFRMLFEEIESENKAFLDIDNPIEQKIFEERDYNNILANLKTYGISSKEKAYIFIDEIQSFPEIIKAIKYLYDHYRIKFFLTGSSSFYLKNLFPESLAGRKTIFELFPLDFKEFLVFKGLKKNFYSNFGVIDKKKNVFSYEKIKKLYEEYLEFGGFPQVVLDEQIGQKKINLNDIFKSYFEKDVRLIADFRDITIFRDLLLLLLQRVGSKLDITKLSSEVGVSRETIYSYISFLQGTYFISLVNPFSRNVDREISGSRKVYVCDNGILNQFSRVDEGSLFENAVFLNLRDYGEIKYYQKRSGGEIDFILLHNNTAFEVKTIGTHKDYSKLSTLASSLGIKKYFIITKKFTNSAGFIPAQDL